MRSRSCKWKTAKAGTNVKIGDIIEIEFGSKTVEVEVLDTGDCKKG